jgi:hypothetical protein
VGCFFSFNNEGFLQAGEGARGNGRGGQYMACTSKIKRGGGQGLWAAGGRTLQELAGAFAGGGMVWRRGRYARAAAAGYSVHAMVGARASKAAEGDGRGRLAEHTGHVGSPPSDSSPAKFPET